MYLQLLPQLFQVNEVKRKNAGGRKEPNGDLNSRNMIGNDTLLYQAHIEVSTLI